MNTNKKVSLVICWQVLLTCLLFWGFTYTLKTNTPAGTDSPTEADDRIREKAAAQIERLDVDHYYTASTTSTYDAADTGKHEVITLLDMSASTQVSGYAHLYMDADELYYQDDTNTTLKLTSGGTINIISADLLGTLANNTYFTAVDAAGTGTVDLIKANGSDVAVIPDGSELATSGAPTADADIANKKYVDDQDTTDHPAYSGGESHVDGSGLIIKMGSVSVATSSTSTVTFSTAFPSGIVSALCSYASASPDAFAPYISSKSTTAITINNRSGSTETIDWMVIGY